MRKHFHHLLASFLLFVTCAVFPQRGSATVLSFEDLPDPADQSLPVPDGYGGIQWSTGHWQYYGEIQFPYTPHSGNNRIFSYSEDNPFLFSAPDIIFDGAWFSGGSGTNDAVRFEFYRSGLLVGSSQALPVTETPAFLASGFTGFVDTVSIVEDPVVRPNDTDFVMDDVTFHSNTATPEPASVALSLLGLIGTVLFRKKIKIS